MHEMCITMVTVARSVFICWNHLVIENSLSVQKRPSLDVLFPERGEQAQERKYAISPLIFFWLEDIQHDYLLSHKVTSFN